MPPISARASAAKTVLITGASRGIGHSIAVSLLTSPPPSGQASCNVILIARTAAPLAQLQTQHPSRVRYVVGDLGDASSYGGCFREAVAIAEREFGRLDTLVLNHGMLGGVARLGDAEVDAWMAVFQVNVMSGVAAIRAALPALRRTGSGLVVVVSSGAAEKSYAGWGAYGASKAAVNHLVATLAVEEAGKVVAVAVRPGVVDTEMQREVREVHAAVMSEGDREKFRGLKERGELVKADDVGGVLARLALGGAGKEGFNGRFVSWNGAELEEFR